MSYKIISQVHLLPPHQRSHFAGSPVSRMIGHYPILELGEIVVEEAFLAQHEPQIKRLLGRGEISLVDLSPAPVQQPAPEPPVELREEPEKAVEEDSESSAEGEEETQPEGHSERSRPKRRRRR